MTNPICPDVFGIVSQATLGIVVVTAICIGSIVLFGRLARWFIRRLVKLDRLKDFRERDRLKFELTSLGYRRAETTGAEELRVIDARSDALTHSIDFLTAMLVPNDEPTEDGGDYFR